MKPLLNLVASFVFYLLTMLLQLLLQAIATIAANPVYVLKQPIISNTVFIKPFSTGCRL
jgi:hypothetical protein